MEILKIIGLVAITVLVINLLAIAIKGGIGSIKKHIISKKD